MIIQACMNGRRGQGDHAAVPVSPAELERDARACVAAGANALHVHPRDASGAQTLEVTAVADALAALRAGAPGVEISFTTGIWIEGDAVRRLARVAAWTALPDVASANVSEPGSLDLIRLLLERGIRVEAGVATAGDARVLVGSGLAARCARAMIEVEGDTAAAIAESEAIDTVLDAAQLTIPRLYHGYDAATWAVIDRAFGLGHDVRIGFEDTLTLPDGSVAADNAALVAACAARVPA